MKGVCSAFTFSGQWQATSVAGCTLWLRASSLGLANGASVLTWNDLSGNGYNATSVVSDPTYTAVSSNGKPAVLFNGDLMTTVSFGMSTPLTFWLVIKQVTWTYGTVIVEGANSGELPSLQPRGSTPQIALYDGSADACTNSNLTIGSYGLVQVIVDGASSSITVGTHSPTTGNPGSGSLTGGLRIGAYVGGGYASNFELSEMIFYSGHQGSSDSAAVLAGLTSIYGPGV